MLYVVVTSGSKLRSLSDLTVISTEFPIASTALTPSIKLNTSPAFIVTSVSSSPFFVIVGAFSISLTLTCKFKVSDSAPKLSLAVTYKSYIPAVVEVNSCITLSSTFLTSKVISSASLS